MTQVFCRVSYSVLGMPNLFNQLQEFVGHFQIQQTIEQSYNKVFDMWFFTDKVELKEGDERQVEIEITESDCGYLFSIKKF